MMMMMTMMMMMKVRKMVNENNDGEDDGDNANSLKACWWFRCWLQLYINYLAFGRWSKQVSLVLFSNYYHMTPSLERSCKFHHLVMSEQWWAAVYTCFTLQIRISGARFASSSFYRLRMHCIHKNSYTVYTRVPECMHQCVLNVWMFSLQTLAKSPLHFAPETPFPGENWQGWGASLYYNPSFNLHSFIVNSFVKNRPDSHLYIQESGRLIFLAGPKTAIWWSCQSSVTWDSICNSCHVW